MGATGRLGCELTHRLEILNANVIPLVFAGYPKLPKRVLWNSKFSPIYVNEIHGLSAIQNFDYVINLHWLADRDRSFINQLNYEIENGIFSLHYVWEWLKTKSFRRFVNVSTIKIFSHRNHNPIDAFCEPFPTSPYGLAKVTAEKFFDSFFIDTSFQVVHLRLGSVASHGEHPSQLMSQLFMSAFQNKVITINKGIMSNIFFIEEAIDLMINSTLKASASKYILCGESLMNEQIASAFEKISGKNITANYNIYAGNNNMIFNSDNASFYDDWVRKYSLDAMIMRIIEQNNSSNAFLNKKEE